MSSSVDCGLFVWTPAFEGASNVYPNPNPEILDPHKFINSVMVYVPIMLIFHGNIHGNNGQYLKKELFFLGGVNQGRI